jgi:hypothetical protein
VICTLGLLFAGFSAIVCPTIEFVRGSLATTAKGE